jgi:outer membrane protein TolC
MQIKIFSLFWLIFYGTVLSAGIISKLVDRGVRSHPKVLSSSFQERAKGFSYEQNVDRYKPQLSISAEWGQENFKYEYSQRDVWYHDRYYSYGITFRQTIINFQLLKAIKDARLKRELASLQNRDQKAQLSIRIAQTAIELIRLSRIRDLAKKKASLYKKAYRDIKSKFDMRLSNSADVAQAKARWKKSEGELAKLNQMYRFTRNNLRFLANVKSIPSSLSKKRFNTGRIRKRYRTRDIKKYIRLINRNTNVLIAKKYCKIANNMIASRKAQRYPIVDFKATYNDGDWGDRVEKENSSRLGVELNMPIYQGGSIGDSINEARMLYYSAREDLNNAKLESKISLEKSWEQIQSGLETLKAIRSAELAGKKYYETTLNAYKNGIQSLTDTYMANIDYYNSVSERINTEAELLNTLLNLYYLIGKATPSTISKFEKRYLK